MKRYTIGWSIFALGMLGMIDPAPAAVRVALLPWVCDDNSYRSGVALANFEASLQAEMAGVADYEWVERIELDKAASELKMKGFALMDQVEGIRSGRWVRADFGVFGWVSTPLDGRQTITLEAVDLRRADVLCETNFQVPAPGDGPFQFKTPQVLRAAAVLQGLLGRACQIYAGEETGRVATLLYFSQEGLTHQPSGLASSFRASLLAESTNHGNFHLVQFQRADAAMDEANLVVGGMAESDPDSWQRVADIYLWGHYSLTDRKEFDRQAGKFADQHLAAVTLHAWGGRSEPQESNLVFTNETTAAIVRQLTLTAKGLLRRDLSKPVAENVRTRISASILAAYEKPFLTSYLGSPESRSQWFDAVQLLETACFFDPGNAAAREQLLRLRWGKGAEMAARNEFFFARRRSEAWGKYVDQFGFQSVLAHPESPDISAESVLSAWRPLEMLDYSTDNQAQWGVPHDTGTAEITAWVNQFAGEFADRLCAAPANTDINARTFDFFYTALHVPDARVRSRLVARLWPRIIAIARQTPVDLDPACLSPLQQHFEEIGQPGGDQPLLAELAAANKQRETQQQAQQEAVPPVVHLPRAENLDSSSDKDIFFLPPMVTSPPLIEPETQTIPFPADSGAVNVRSIAFYRDKLWLAVEVGGPVKIESVNNRIGQEFHPVLANETHLWKMDVQRQSLGPVDGPLATNGINDMELQGDTLWLSLTAGGVAALNLQTGKLLRYETSATGPIGSQLKLAFTSRGVAAMGENGELSFLENEAAPWRPFPAGLPLMNPHYDGAAWRLAGQEETLALYNHGLFTCQLPSKAWKRITNGPPACRMGLVSQMKGDENGSLWLVSQGGLHQVDLRHGVLRSQWTWVSPTVRIVAFPDAPGIKLPLSSSGGLMAHIREKLDLRRSEIQAQKIDPAHASAFAPTSRLADSIRSLALDGDFLWALTPHSILLYHPATRRWVGGFTMGGTGTPLAAACGDGKLWVAATTGPSLAVLAIPADGLKATPQASWLNDTISQAELEARLADLTESDRIVYEFFAGHDAEVLRRLQARRETDLDAQSLFLLAQVCQETGRMEQARHFQEELHARFNQSLFVAALDKSPQWQAGPP